METEQKNAEITLWDKKKQIFKIFDTFWNFQKKRKFLAYFNNLVISTTQWYKYLCFDTPLESRWPFEWYQKSSYSRPSIQLLVNRTLNLWQFVENVAWWLNIRLVCNKSQGQVLIKTKIFWTTAHPLQVLNV